MCLIIKNLFNLFQQADADLVLCHELYDIPSRHPGVQTTDGESWVKWQTKEHRVSKYRRGSGWFCVRLAFFDIGMAYMTVLMVSFITTTDCRNTASKKSTIICFSIFPCFLYFSWPLRKQWLLNAFWKWAPTVLWCSKTFLEWQWLRLAHLSRSS